MNGLGSFVDRWLKPASLGDVYRKKYGGRMPSLSENVAGGIGAGMKAVGVPKHIAETTGRNITSLAEDWTPFGALTAYEDNPALGIAAAVPVVGAKGKKLAKGLGANPKVDVPLASKVDVTDPHPKDPGEPVVKSPASNTEIPVASKVDLTAPQGLGAFKARGHHGSQAAGLTEFDLSKAGSATGGGHLGTGVYLSTDPKVPETYPHRYEADVELANPLRVSLPNWKTDKSELVRETLGLPKDASYDAISEALRAKGYDGVVLDYSPAGYAHQEIMALDPKSAKIVQPKGLGGKRKSRKP